MERMTNIFQVLEEVQMIFFNVQNNPDCREEMKKTIRVLTGFCDKCFGFSYTDIPSDSLENTADRNRRVNISFQ